MYRQRKKGANCPVDGTFGSLHQWGLTNKLHLDDPHLDLHTVGHIHFEAVDGGAPGQHKLLVVCTTKYLLQHLRTSIESPTGNCLLR